MDTIDKVFNYILARTVGAAGGLILSSYSPRMIPRESKVQPGFVAPNRLKVNCEDQDGNGELETVLQIDDKKYLLRDVNGTPTLSEYEVKPAEIQYK